MTDIPENLKYKSSHEWVKVDGEIATVGITDHAQAELTDLVFIELPQISSTLNAGDPCAVVESVKTASDIYSPLSGTIIEINNELNSNPGLVNTSPYNEGWMFKIQLSNPVELNDFMTSEEYKNQIG